MRIITVKTLKEYGEKHADVHQSLLARNAEVEKAVRNAPNDIMKKYPTASIIQNNRVVFRIRGNAYRLIVSVSYTHHIVRVKFVGTHQEYDKIDATTVDNY